MYTTEAYISYLIRICVALLLPYLCLEKGYLCADDALENGIDIVFHIATMNNWQSIVNEQLGTIEKSGLGTACDSLTMTVVGTQILEVHELVKNLSFQHKVTIIHASEDFQQYEFPGIEAVIKIAQNKPNTKILYIHSKGVTHHNKHSEIPVRLWRRYMEYFTIERWEDCIKALDTVDTCGVDLTRSALELNFYAGNFWWTRS